jgi:hypothetical protein
MPTWIFRKSVDGERVGEPRQCTGPLDIERIVGVLTIEEQIAVMLNENEEAQPGDACLRTIYSDSQVVGYIVVLSTDLP